MPFNAHISPNQGIREEGLPCSYARYAPKCTLYTVYTVYTVVQYTGIVYKLFSV